MKRAILVLSSLFLLCGANWRDDLRFMASEMEKTHKNLYHSISRERFAEMVAMLDRKIPSLTREEITVEMMRIAAAVGDGHTNINPARDAKIGFRELPVAFYFFEDGFYVRAARADLRQIVGKQVTHIGKTSIHDAFQRVRPIIARDNEQGVYYWTPIFLTMPEILFATGIVPDQENVTLTFDDGQTTTLHPAGPYPPLPSDTDATWARREGWIDARGDSDPLWLRDPLRETRMEVVGKTLYAQINKIDKELQTFGPAIRDRIAKGDIDKLVIDLRLNRGGRGDYKVFLLRSVIQSMAVDQPGRFFVLIGRSTFSAAQDLADQFERFTNVTFVGEMSGSKGTTYGDSKKITLPDSGITVRASKYYWQHWDPWDARQGIVPKILAPLTMDAYRKNVDPALEAVLGPRP